MIQTHGSSRVFSSPYRKHVKYYLDGSPFASGAFGRVFRVTDRTSLGIPLAAKYLRDREAGEREANALGAAQGHPNILPFYDAFPDPHLQGFWMVTERCECDLYDGLDHLPLLRDRHRLLIQVGEGIAWLHALGIAHRDIKPENILLTRDPKSPPPSTPTLSFPSRAAGPSSGPDYDPANWIVRIADFGLASPATDSIKITGGSPGYMAPEAFDVYMREKEGPAGSYAPFPADTWSLGILATLLLTDRMLWEAPTVQDPRYAYFVQHPVGGLKKLIGVDVPLETTLKCALHPQPERRSTVAAWTQSMANRSWGKGKVGEAIS